MNTYSDKCLALQLMGCRSALNLFLDGPSVGLCWLTNALNVSATKCGCWLIILFQPGVSITSEA